MAKKSPSVRTLERGARYERVSGHVSRTTAHRQMIDGVAFGVNAARAGARVTTLAKHACLIARTVGINDAFRSTFDVRIAAVLGYACANPVVASGVLAARRWIASVCGSF